MICRSADSHLPFIWIGTAEPAFWSQDHKTSASPIHFALAAKDRAAVERFYVAALAAGGTDNGQPGARGAPVMKYFAAFVLDPDGNNVEAGIRE